MNRQFDWRRVAKRAAALLLLLLGTVVITITVDDEGRPVVRVSPVLPGAGDLPVKSSPEAVEIAREGQANPDTPGVPEATERKIERANDARIARQTYDSSGVLRGAAAQPAALTCLTPQRGAARAYSDIGLNVVHVTVSKNVVGLGDVRGLCDFFRRVKASPTWTVDNEGNSALNVPLTYTPWTQKAFNRRSCSTEFVGSTGRPGEGAAQWTDVQLREGARLAAACHRLAGIPVRRGQVNGQLGSVLRTGVVTHQELGVAGGNHRDPGPYFNMDRYLAYLRQFVEQAKPVSANAQRQCRKLNRYRRAGRNGSATARSLKRNLTQHSYVCGRSGATRV